MTHSHPLLLFLLLSLTASARVQTRNFHDAGACASFRRGESVGSSVDLDHDPYDEHLVASPGADTGGKTDNGLTKALSDSTRAVP